MIASARARGLALAMAGVAAVAGCHSGARRGDQDNGAGGRPRLVLPKRCLLKVAIIPRRLGDRVINEVLWGAADEQAVAPEVRRALEANGLRVGVIPGALPTEVQELLRAGPPHKIDPAIYAQIDGDPALIPISPKVAVKNLLLVLDGRATGRDYRDATGLLRVAASRDGTAGVSLRIVPEIHHGEVRHRVSADLPTGPFEPLQLTQRPGQEEENFRDLAATLAVEPGQVAVVGSRPDRRGSLGDFLMTEAEPNSDRLLQKVLLIWATRAPDVSEGAAPETLQPIDPETLAPPSSSPTRGGLASPTAAPAR
ncbi:MAG TPA: hypothetical protein VG406_01475 [Isosphaeraceae bacterium]|jgi:hypothetical protein|nr:hypothetical protein [Isosphaeraceae bacterium]